MGRRDICPTLSPSKIKCSFITASFDFWLPKSNMILINFKNAYLEKLMGSTNINNCHCFQMSVSCKSNLHVYWYCVQLGWPYLQEWAKHSESESFTSELLSKEGKLTTHDGKTVTDLFPEFRPGQVLRFSRLFGPAKASSMPQQWRNAKKRKKKKKKQGEDEKTVIEPPKSPPSPRPEDCMSDDEVSQMLFKKLWWKYFFL